LPTHISFSFFFSKYIIQGTTSAAAVPGGAGGTAPVEQRVYAFQTSSFEDAAAWCAAIKAASCVVEKLLRDAVDGCDGGYCGAQKTRRCILVYTALMRAQISRSLI
jgi:hypothetical protein